MTADVAPTVRFAGRAWTVKVSAGPVGPGPNRFSAENVNLDASGRLVLRVRPDQTGWTCAEVVAQGDYGYGDYRWRVATDVRGLYPQVVLGLFTWSDEQAQANRELDIEFSRWGRAAETRSESFAVQTPRGPITRRFPPGVAPGEHTLIWAPGRVVFRSRFGAATHTWTHAGPHVPTPGGGVAPRMNLWLFRGLAPAAEQAVVIESFEHAAGG